MDTKPEPRDTDDELIKLTKLRDDGKITDEEFRKTIAELIRKSASPHRAEIIPKKILWKVVLPIYWLLLWRTLWLFPFTLILGFIIGFIMGVLGFSTSTITWFTGILGFVLGPIWGIVVVQMALNKKYADFQLAVVPNPKGAAPA